jgi:hypothetical protein
MEDELAAALMAVHRPWGVGAADCLVYIDVLKLNGTSKEWSLMTSILHKAKHWSRAGLAASILLLTACMVARAPGSDQVKLTTSAADVASCTAVGNVRPAGGGGLSEVDNAPIQFRNDVVGLGGNVGLVTEGLLGVPAAGIAYRCP